MWDVPYNRQFWQTWLAVGLTSHTQIPSYKEMYNTKDDNRFVRKNAGHRFEFSDGKKFIIIADMDGDSTSKPILRVGLVPLNDGLLGANIR